VVPLTCDGGVACDNDDVLFTFNYRPLHSGAHRMRVRVDGNDVVGSPFTIVVPAQASKLQQPSVLPSPSARVPSTPVAAVATDATARERLAAAARVAAVGPVQGVVGGRAAGGRA
jgi:ApbE superfamily uncharacterized protein (UPF0280 family)